MPRGDRTGPNGMGPMTGRAMGYCAGYDRPGFANYGVGRRMGFWGRGMGYGRGRGPGTGALYAAHPVTPVHPETENQALRAEVEMLRTQLDNIMKRLDELSGG